ncbi:amidase [Paraburkholderia caballeronis]|uniref:amidase n=1 Tax=Paraburkholderia caballeronis TaxID=416943 RepID=UPI001066877F|nr:amidase [Paraburkholderia caballeronis]TDV33909.1 amidase [Paraburkholderia caballeronis]
MNHADLLQPGLHRAFVRDGFGALPPAALPSADARPSSLSGARLAVKDVFDVAGLRTGGGNPAWRDAQPLAAATAPAVRLLLERGMRWVGKTVTDELTYSLAGINAHYGTPENPADPARLPGGSSSGSAVAVAAGDADIGLGTDCGGSIRLPASYCGIWGIRPTHGRIAGNGCVTLAHSFDTVGWFARDAALLADVLGALTHGEPAAPSNDVRRARIVVPNELLALLHPAARAAFDATCARLRASWSIDVRDAGFSPPAWADAFRVLQAAEVAAQHGPWATAHLDTFGADVRARFAAALAIAPDQVAAAQRVRVNALRSVARLFADADTFVVMPTLPWVAPRVDASGAEIDDIRRRSQQMLCIAGLAGLPQVSLPWTAFDGAPLGLSVTGARGDDEAVLALARALHAALMD